jgi:error-prone DNA polymerase
MEPRYAELHAHSNFTFLDGGSHPEELVRRARELGIEAIALTDRDGLYGAVRFAQAGRDEGVAALVGAELTLEDDTHLVVVVEDARGYAHLSRMISRARLSSPRGVPVTTYERLAAHAQGLIALSGCAAGAVARALESGDLRRARAAAGRLREIFGRENFWIELQRHFLPEDGPRIHALAGLAQDLDLGLVATGGVHYAVPEHRDLADVLTCIRHRTTLENAGTLLRPNGEYYLRSPHAMARLFGDHPEAVANSVRLAERCRFRLEKQPGQFPDFPVPDGETPFSYLSALVDEGVRRRYRPPTPEVQAQVAHELAVIDKLDLAGYFLIVWDIVRFARQHGILVQGRGSAANSVVCYALGITSVDPIGLHLLFERFLSEERDEPPDIDLDTPSGEQRERILQYVYDRYGRDHAALVSEVITYCARNAVRDIGKVLGLPDDTVRELADSLEAHAASRAADELTHSAASGDATAQLTAHGEWRPVRAAEVEKVLAATAVGHRVEDATLRRLAALCRRIDGFPRHLSQHVGGMVITRSPLIEVAPLEPAAMPGRTILCWDKDDCAALGLIKIDILGLGMLNAIAEATAMIERSRGIRIEPADMRLCNDERVYEMLCAADTVGVFQVESRAQMATLPRLRPRCFYDLVVQVAIIRPGPIQGDMVHPYLRRRQGREPVTYPHPRLQPVLERTLGVPLFQEQGMRMAIVAAGFTAGEADELRRAMGHKRSREKMERLRSRLLAGMARNGIEPQVARRLFDMLSAFADFGFPESHAASFALLVYLSAYLKRFYAPEFYAALLNAQPMGFYAPATLIADARRHNVTVLPPDVNASRYACTVEPLVAGAGTAPAPGVACAWSHPTALRIGLRYVRGLGETYRERLDGERARGPYADLRDFVLRTRLPKQCLLWLAGSGAFGCFGLARRDALWEVQRLAGVALAGELERHMDVCEPPVRVPAMTPLEEAAADYRVLGLSPRYHVLEFCRAALDARGVYRACDLAALPNGRILAVAGLVTVRQRPGTAKGFVFTTLEDETGLINVIIRPDVYARYRRLVRTAPAVIVEGRLQKADGGVSLLARRVWRLENAPLAAHVTSRDFH